MEPVHLCELKNKFYEEVTNIPPNETSLRKCLIWLKKKNTINMSSKESKRYFVYRQDIVAERNRHYDSKFFYITHPFSAINIFQEVYGVFTLFLGLLIIPFYFTFNPEDEYWVVVKIWLFFFGGYIIQNCFKGVVRKKEGIILDHPKIMRFYLKSYFIFDLTNFLIFIFQDVTNSIWAFTWLLLLTRLATLNQLSYSILIRLHVGTNTIEIVNYFFTMMFLIHFFSCLIYQIPDYIHFLTGVHPINSWLITHNLLDEDVIEKYFACVKLTMSHFFGSGLANYNLKEQLNEQISFTIILLCGRTYTLFVWSRLLVIFGFINLSQTKYEEIQNQIYKFMRINKLPRAITDRIMKFYEYKFQKHYFDESELLNRMPIHMRNEVHLYSCRILIEKTEAFRNLSKGAMGEIMTYFKQEIYMPHDVIIKCDDFIENIYFISFGTVMYLNRKGNEVLHYTDGNQIGILSFFFSSEERYMMTAIALEITEVYKISKSELLKLFVEYPDIEQKFYKKAFKDYKKFMKLHDFNAEVMPVNTFIANLHDRRLMEEIQKRPIMN
ncbi:unnamed protein product [Brassicogethes aeneus]|uniref:Cyclic nucleotide-binding domain-containing protein n=1 Tax=Brassicogethes aeneus TaxID=1431903 RepID=A0A9P0BJD8_BRAAE|nr:unnamed protein product [Brassicogethes aeneus]